LNATLNGGSIGVPNNGLYGTATWDWFTDVDHHFDDPFYQAGDFDGNSTNELCHLLYEVDCPNTGGLIGGCCGPCWGAPLGTILPPGWFAYGINGSCGTPGPPIRVDWGDGNTCGSGMGPWRFCFDLVVREYPDCQEDATKSDLSLGFFTFADGQVGSWTGSASVCALDQPAKLTLPMNCIEPVDFGIVELPPICSGDSINYVIFHPEIDQWSWSISPGGFVQNPEYEGENGNAISQRVINQTSQPQLITYRFHGSGQGSPAIVVGQMQFVVYPQIRFPFPDITVCERDSSMEIIPAISGGTGNYEYNWWPSGTATPVLTLLKPFPGMVGLTVTDEVGCRATGEMQIKTRPCHLMDTDPPQDDDNDPDHPMDPPPPDENLMETPIALRGPGLANDFSIKPIPARDRVIVTMLHPLDANEVITVSDVNGTRIMQIDINRMQGIHASMDIDSWPDGLYIVTLHTAQGPVSRRMIKM
jgi:hypothetical protein